MTESIAKNQKKGYLYAITAVLIWSTVASAFKVTLRYLDFRQLLFFSALTSILILFIIMIGQRKLKVLKSYTKDDYLSSLLLGFLNPFLYYIFLFRAYSLLRAQEALTLNYTWAIMIVILSIPLLGQVIKLKSILAIIISFIGVFIIATEGKVLQFHFTNLAGVALALGSSVIWALFWIYNIRNKRDVVVKLFLNFLFGFILILVYTLLSSGITIPDYKGIGGAVYVGLFEMGITFIFWLKALRFSETTAKIANLIYLSPFISLVLIRHIVGEPILSSSIIGLIFIITGIIIEKKVA